MRTPILTLRLLDIPMPDDPGTKKLLLGGAIDLVREHEELFVKQGMDIRIFHNSDIQYSAIQIDRYQQSPEWTAIGQQAVKALEVWYELFKKDTPMPLQNTIEIRELYTPDFLPYQKKYQAECLLVSDNLAKALNPLTDKFARFDMLEKYLYGNLQGFFKHIGYEHDKNAHFLKVTVLSLKPFKHALPVFQRQKKTAFLLAFKCNFRLPQTLRIGQSTALGYGKVAHL